MAGSVRKILMIFFGLALLLTALYWVFRPQPVPVDLASIQRGDLEVTIRDDGTTRIRDVYTVSAPVAGTVRRTPMRVGDAVAADQTVVALLQPAAPSFLDARTRREAEAALAAANAAVELAEAQLREAQADAILAQNELSRVQELANRDVASERLLEEAQAAMHRSEARVASAQAMVEMRAREKESAQARLIGPEMLEGGGAESCCIELFAPVDGEILTIHHESQTVVTAGTPLVEVGNRADLEVVAEFLSSDAVRIPPNAPAQVEDWGGPPLEAKVHRVEPAGFTKVSALGIEEQRVRTIIRLLAPPEERLQLGHGYRVTTRVTLERHEDVLLVPIGALFRQGEDWAVFVAGPDEQASLRRIRIAERDGSSAIVISGLEEGERVILHPSDRITEGTVIVER